MEDSSFIKQLQGGEEQGLIAAYQRYRQPLLFFVLRYVKNQQVAEDIVADVFVKAWDMRHSFQREDGLRAFLYVAAKNASLNALRKPQHLAIDVELDQLEDVFMADSDIFSNIVRSELMKSIMEEVEKLPQKQGLIFRYTFLEELSVEEISEKLQLSANAVYATRSRALATLRDLLIKRGVVVSFTLLPCITMFIHS